MSQTCKNCNWYNELHFKVGDVKCCLNMDSVWYTAEMDEDETCSCWFGEEEDGN